MAINDYLDFELNIEAPGTDRIRVTVDDSPVGSVSVEVANPFTTDEIAQVIGVLEGSISVNKSQRNNTIRNFGEKLFTTIFAGQIYAAYLASQERAADGLRIRLCLEDAGVLADLPWELLRDPSGDYLALSRQTPIIRYPRVLTVRPILPVSLPLRVLVMISSPSDQEQLDVESEWRALEEATATLRSRGLLELARLDDAQLITLQRKLRESTDYHVFHYIGHAAFDERSKTGMLAFENAQGTGTTPISGEALARELSEESSIRLVVLNACQAARENLADPFAGVASSVVQRGIAGVVAMQFTIGDDASRVFAQEFYRALSEGYPIEAAMAESRRSLSSALTDYSWSTPVLYLRADSSILFPRGRGLEGFSAGGIRELLRSPRGLLVVAGVIALLIGGLFLFRALTSSGRPSIPSGNDVDLAVTSLRFSPPNPAPGQKVSVAMIIRNLGTTDSGTFRWAWYAHDIEENPEPSIVNEVANIPPGGSLNVKGDFYFGLWDTYITTAWVNFDGQVQETNLVNNLRLQPAIMDVEKPMVVDFTTFPNGDVILEPVSLKGDEFNQWGFQIAPAKEADPNCANAAVQIEVEPDVNQLRPGLPDNADACSNLPINVTLDQPVGSASVEFVASVPGSYTLDVFNAAGEKLDSQTVEATDSSAELTITVPADDAQRNDIQRVTFSGPPDATVEIQLVTFTAPVEPE